MDLFSMNFEHFAHKPNFFPYFRVWQGKMPSAWAAPRSGATAGSARRLDYTLEGRDPSSCLGFPRRGRDRRSSAANTATCGTMDPGLRRDDGRNRPRHSSARRRGIGIDRLAAQVFSTFHMNKAGAMMTPLTFLR